MNGSKQSIVCVCVCVSIYNDDFKTINDDQRIRRFESLIQKKEKEKKMNKIKIHLFNRFIKMRSVKKISTIKKKNEKEN